jgi:HAMP domain-containing protein
MRHVMVVLGMAVSLIGCRTRKSSDQATGYQTASPYTGSSDSGAGDSGAGAAGIAGTNSGAALEAPRRIPGVFAALSQMKAAGKVDQANLTALRGDLSDMESGMRDDLRRAGQADTGAFGHLADSISRRLGGGPGGLAKQLNSKEIGELSGQVQRLVDRYNRAMGRPGS